VLDILSVLSILSIGFGRIGGSRRRDRDGSRAISGVVEERSNVMHKEGVELLSDFLLVC
jgi:hypothetical protein